MKILLIEDDKEISKMLCSYLFACIVSAYKNKTMNLMFLYPIKRQKILISQMLAVCILGLWYSPAFCIPVGLSCGDQGFKLKAVIIMLYKADKRY